MQPSVLVCLSSFLLCSLVISSLCVTTVHGEGRPKYVEGNITSFMVSTTTCSIPPGTGNNAMKVTHPYGPCTSNNVNYTVDYLAILDNDEIWVSRLQNRSNPLESKSTFPIRRGLNEVRSGNYIVNVGLGTPRVEQKVIFDTGSTVSWVQCEPYCTTATCRSQTDRFYNPFLSTTGRSVNCLSRACSLLRNRPNCQRNKCTFSVTYGDQSTTAGYLMADTLALTPTDVTTNFVFGCAAADSSSIFGRVTGLFGLGRDPLSMTSQLSSTHGNVFSYCLPMSDSSVGFYNFGPIQTPSSSIYYTPMLVVPRHSIFYGVGLTGISVGGQRLNIPPSVFTTAGTFLDSGTVISRLPPTAYYELRRVFTSSMSTGYRRIASISKTLDTCYDLTGMTRVSVPAVSLHFGTLELELAYGNIMYSIVTSTTRYGCLAFAGNPTVTEAGIIGNQQQKTLEIIHDLNYQRIGFAAGRC